jgi:hypothetical protein
MGPHGTLVLVATVGVIGVSCAWVMSATSLAVRLPRRARLAIGNGLRRGNTEPTPASGTPTRHARVAREEAVTATMTPVRVLPSARVPYALEGAPAVASGNVPTWGVESWSRAIAAYGALLQQAIGTHEPDDYATEEALTFEEVATSFGANPLDWHSGGTGAWPFAREPRNAAA